MRKQGLSRRRILACAVGAGLGLGARGLAGENGPPSGDAAPASPKEALQRLIDGNKRFVAGESAHDHTSTQWRKGLVGGQRPFAAVLGCSDSRVPPELIFDQGLGDLFVIRVAGNVVAADGAGSIEYADLHLHVRLVVVLGHEGCGAVGAALDALYKREENPEAITALVKLIEPAFAGLDPKLTGEAQLHAAVETNVRWSMRQIAESPDGKKALEEKRLDLVGAVYQLDTGTVRFLS